MQDEPNAAPQPDNPQLLPLEISSSPILERLPALRDRLLALTPDDPVAYLELGEELSADAVVRDDIELAQHTLALAYILESASKSPSKERLAGICIALADAERLPDRAHWFRSVAESINPSLFQATSAPSGQIDDQHTGFLAAAALGQVRTGNASQAARLLREPGVRAIIAKNQSLLIGGGDASSVTWIEDEVRRWPCPECRNARIIRRPGLDGLETRICPWCGGDPGPTLNRDQLLAQLRLESYLLAGVGTSWTAQIARDFGAPLRDPDPEEVPHELFAKYNASIDAPYYRDGQWVSATVAIPREPR